MPAASGPTSADRILIYGVTGSGKSIAAQQIGASLGLPVTLVDELTWLPGWVAVESDRQRDAVSAITSTDRWVLDSAYGAWIDVVLPRTELIVALDYPRWFSLQRLLRRTVRRVLTKESVCNGNTESFRSMFGRDSIIGWHFKSFPRKRERMRRWLASADGPPVLLMRSPRDLDAWMATLRAKTSESED